MNELVQAGAGMIEVETIRHGQTITKPGVYDMPMGWYHDDCCEGPSVSSSGLRTIWQKSPLHYWHTSPLNKDRADAEDDAEESAALRIGRAAHTLLLEPLTFRKLFVTRPAIFDSWRTKDSKAWRANAQLEGFTVLDPAEMQRVVGVHAALKRHPLYERGILDGDIERALIWKDEKTGVWLKSRPDVIPRGSNIFADLKVVNDCRAPKLSRKIFDFGYDIQMAMAGVGMWEVLKRSMEDFVLVAVESKEPHAARIAPISHDEIKRALSILRWAVNRFAECLAANHWPSFEEDDNDYIHRSDYEAKRIERMIEAGVLPKEY